MRLAGLFFAFLAAAVPYHIVFATHPCPPYWNTPAATLLP